MKFKFGSKIFPKFLSNKLGIMFTASLVLFLTTLMIFAITNYRATQQAEDNLAAHAALSRLSGIYWSVSESVRDIYLATLNISIIQYKAGNGNSSKDILNISTNLMSSGTPVNLSRKMLILDSFFQTMASYIRLNTSIFSADPNLSISPGIMFSKSERNSTKGEVVRFYYNLSGEAMNMVSNVSMYFRSVEKMRFIGWNASAAPTGAARYYVQTRDTATPYTENMTFTLGAITGTNTYSLTISNTTAILINITFDSEKFMIEQVVGNYNLTLELWMNSSGRNFTYFIGSDRMIDVNTTYSGTRKIGRADFI